MRNPNQDQGRQFRIYRKNTHSRLRIRSSDQIKPVGIRGIFRKAYKICGVKFIDQEVRFISDTVLKLDYTYNFIEMDHFKARL